MVHSSNTTIGFIRAFDEEFDGDVVVPVEFVLKLFTVIKADDEFPPVLTLSADRSIQNKYDIDMAFLPCEAPNIRFEYGIETHLGLAVDDTKSNPKLRPHADARSLRTLGL